MGTPAHFLVSLPRPQICSFPVCLGRLLLSLPVPARPTTTTLPLLPSPPPLSLSPPFPPLSAFSRFFVPFLAFQRRLWREEEEEEESSVSNPEDFRPDYRPTSIEPGLPASEEAPSFTRTR